MNQKEINEAMDAWKKQNDAGNVICMDGPDVIVICDANGPWACKIKIGGQDGK